MPKQPGTFVNLKNTQTHAFHGISIHNGTPTHLSKSIELDLKTQDKGFAVSIHNKATHALFVHPLRLGQLKVSIERGKNHIVLKPIPFHRAIGKAGKPTMPWLADTVLKDTTIKADEIRIVQFDTALQKGDTVIIELGYHIANPKMAAKLGIKDKWLTGFTRLTQKRVIIE